jgi:hypothetical protein
VLSSRACVQDNIAPTMPLPDWVLSKLSAMSTNKRRLRVRPPPSLLLSWC